MLIIIFNFVLIMVTVFMLLDLIFFQIIIIPYPYLERKCKSISDILRLIFFVLNANPLQQCFLTI
jgi:hypothetical protein